MAIVNSYVKLPEGIVTLFLNKQLDPENSQFLMVSLVFQPRQLPGSMLIYQRLLSKYGDISRYKQITKRWMMVGWWWVRGLTSMDSRLRTPAGFQWIRDFTIWAAVCFAIDQWGWNGWNDLVNIVILAWIQWGQYVFLGFVSKRAGYHEFMAICWWFFVSFSSLGFWGLPLFTQAIWYEQQKSGYIRMALNDGPPKNGWL